MSACTACTSSVLKASVDMAIKGASTRNVRAFEEAADHLVGDVKLDLISTCDDSHAMALGVLDDLVVKLWLNRGKYCVGEASVNWTH